MLLQQLKQFAVGYLIGVALVAMLFVLAPLAHCAVGNKHVNSLGVPMFFDNPMTYKAGSVTALAYVDGGLVARIQPIGTYSLFTEDILFCSTSPEKFLNKSNPMVLTYRTKASRMIQGVGCHELVVVQSIKTESIK